MTYEGTLFYVLGKQWMASAENMHRYVITDSFRQPYNHSLHYLAFSSCTHDKETRGDSFCSLPENQHNKLLKPCDAWRLTAFATPITEALPWQQDSGIIRESPALYVPAIQRQICS